MYFMGLALVKVVQQPTVGMDKKFPLRRRPHDLVVADAAGVSGVLCHAVPEDCYKVWIFADIGVLAPQNTHESAKTTLTISKNTFQLLARVTGGNWGMPFLRFTPIILI